MNASCPVEPFLCSGAAWQWNSDPFGNGDALGGPYDLRFPGQYFDQATKLHYNYFRDYDPRLGRYIESDPIGLAGGINTYAYVGGNPVNLTDPLGLTIGGIFGKLWKYFCSPDDNDPCAAAQNLLNTERQQLIDVRPNLGGNVIPLPGSSGNLDVIQWNLDVRDFNLRAAFHNQDCPRNQVAPLDTITFE